MYCSNCGTQVSSQDNVCRNCGKMLKDNSTQTKEPTMTQEEYLKRNRSDSYVLSITLSVISDIVGSIMLIWYFAKYYDTYKSKEHIYLIFVGLGLWLIGSILLIVAKSHDNTLIQQYKSKYENQNNNQPANTPSVFKNISLGNTQATKPAQTPQSTEWKCKNCGRINQEYVGTCGCGEIKPR